MHSRTVNYVSVANRETGSTPRALDRLSLKLAFGQRAAEVRALLVSASRLGRIRISFAELP
jgi:hypothetical protein